jgi:hypothetical protein
MCFSTAPSVRNSVSAIAWLALALHDVARLALEHLADRLAQQVAVVRDHPQRRPAIASLAGLRACPRNVRLAAATPPGEGTLR